MTKNDKNNFDTLRIVEANVEDVNRGIVRIHPFVFRTVALKENDPINLTNAKNRAMTVAFVKSSSQKEMSLDEIKVCAALRRNLKAELKDLIIIQSASVVPAKIIVFTSLNKIVCLKNSNLLAQKLLGRVVTTQDIVSFNSPKGRIDLQVLDYIPKEAEAVLIGKNARIEFINKITKEHWFKLRAML